jgi:hypothetical protein
MRPVLQRTAGGFLRKHQSPSCEQRDWSVNCGNQRTIFSAEVQRHPLHQLISKGSLSTNVTSGGKKRSGRSTAIPFQHLTRRTDQTETVAN